MRHTLALVGLLMVTSCDSPVAEVPPPEAEGVADGGDAPAIVAVPEVEFDPPAEQETEAWLARHGPTFEAAASAEYVARYGEPVRVADMLAAMRATPARGPIQFDWPVEERVDLSRTSDVGLALARVTWSEEGVGRPESADALWQVARNVRARHCNPREEGERVHRGRRALIPITQCASSGGAVRDVVRGQRLEGWEETTLSSLRRLSRFVTGMAPPHRQRGEWLSTLATCGTAPTGWRECVDADGDGDSDGSCDGAWAHYTRRCSDLLAHTRALVAMEYPPRPCRGLPLAWGGDMDHAIMERRNAARQRAGVRPLEVLDCGDVENTYYGYPADDPAAEEEPVATIATTEELPSDDSDGRVASGQVISGSPSAPF